VKKKISQLIEYDVENSTLDFKQEEYPVGKKHPKRNEILKDLSSFANHPSDQDKFIIIGVIEKDGRAKDFQNLPEITDEAKYQQIINSNIEPKLNFEYKTIDYKSYRLAYFQLYKNFDRPYLFKKQLINPKTQKIDFNEGDGFIRMGTSTRKMLRQDFDNIYQEKWKSKDRKTDIEIEFFSSRQDEEYSFLPFLDMHISNISNKSISMDVEMEIKKNDLYNVIEVSN
jgi:predicted HTH transcriptional regulator